MITENDIRNTFEQLQEDVMCILDGIDDEDRLENLICQGLVENMYILIEKLKS